AIILVEGDSLARLVLVYKHLVEARVGYPLPLETIQKEASPARDRSNCLCGILLAIAGSIGLSAALPRGVPDSSGKHACHTQFLCNRYEFGQVLKPWDRGQVSGEHGDRKKHLHDSVIV